MCEKVIVPQTHRTTRRTAPLGCLHRSARHSTGADAAMLGGTLHVAAGGLWYHHYATHPTPD